MLAILELFGFIWVAIIIGFIVMACDSKPRKPNRVAILRQKAKEAEAKQNGCKTRRR